MDSDVTFVDIVVLIIIIVLIFLMAWVIKLTNQLQKSKIDKLCKKGLSINLKQGSLVQKLIGVGPIPSEDVQINFSLNC